METICKNCNADLLGEYCKDCGQKNYKNEDKSLKHIVEEAFHFTTHFDGTFFTTLGTVVAKPGKLSADYCNGIRKKYYKPISFFLILIVIYLIFPVMEGLNMRMEFYRNSGLYGPFISEQIDSKIAASNVSEKQLSDDFHAKSEKVSKVMLLLLIPLTAGALWLLYFYKKRAAFDHFIMATEINIVTVLLFFLLWPLLLKTLFWLFHLLVNEQLGATMLTIAFLTYLTIALKRFYKDHWLMSFGKAILFVFLYFVVTQIIYKFVLFQVTFLLL